MTNVALLLALGAAVVILATFLSARRRRAAFKGRDDLAATRQFEQHFADTGLDEEVFARHWDAGARLLGISPGLLRPDDRFESELRSSGLWDQFEGKRDDLAAYAAKEARRHNGILDLNSVATFGELVVALTRLETSQGLSS